MKQLMESVNDVGPMCRSGNTLLASFGGNEMILKMVPDVLKAELHVIAEIVLSTIEGLPIAEKKPTQPSLSTLIFYSDAAGPGYSLVEGKRMYHNNEIKGVSCIGGASFEDLWIWTRLGWPVC